MSPHLIKANFFAVIFTCLSLVLSQSVCFAATAEGKPSINGNTVTVDGVDFDKGEFDNDQWKTIKDAYNSTPKKEIKIKYEPAQVDPETGRVKRPRKIIDVTSNPVTQSGGSDPILPFS